MPRRELPRRARTRQPPSCSNARIRTPEGNLALITHPLVSGSSTRAYCAEIPKDALTAAECSTYRTSAHCGDRTTWLCAPISVIGSALRA